MTLPPQALSATGSITSVGITGVGNPDLAGDELRKEGVADSGSAYDLLFKRGSPCSRQAAQCPRIAASVSRSGSADSTSDGDVASVTSQFGTVLPFAEVCERIAADEADRLRNMWYGTTSSVRPYD